MKGKSWGTEWKLYRDPDTGAIVRQLTDYYSHHYQLFFTNPGWFANGRKLLIGGERENKNNLFSVDLESGEILQITDFDRIPAPNEIKFQDISVNPKKDEVYFWRLNQLFAVDLNTLEERVLWDSPEGYLRAILSVTSDGQYIMGSRIRDLAGWNKTDLRHINVDYTAFWAARPHSMIYKTPVNGGPTQIVFEDDYWIRHVNTSPTQPNILTFCHEGPWDKVDHRVWAFDHVTGKAWKVRERKFENERVGHEYWYADGVTIGYHGSVPDADYHCFGRIRYDNTCEYEMVSPFHIGSVHAHDETYIVGDDSSKYIMLWRYRSADNTYEGPRALCVHSGGHSRQFAQAYPRFTPDGKHVLFNSSQTGYGSPYIVDIPAFESLPAVS